MVFMEYRITYLAGLTEYDPYNRTVQILMVMLATPFVWMFLYILSPYIAVFMPIILIIYYHDQSLFQRDAKVFIYSVKEQE